KMLYDRHQADDSDSRARNMTKEHPMRPLNALFRNGLISAIGLLIIFAIAQTSQAEYNNPSVAEKGTVAYWMDRGGMLSTYGNFLGAVQAYGKALTLDPQNAEAYFDTGLAQGQM